MRRVYSLEKSLMLEGIGGRRRRGRQRMRSLTQWAWVLVSSRRWWRTGRSGLLRSMGLQRVGHERVTELSIQYVLCLVTQLYLTLYNPLDCRLADSSSHGIFQARILEWVAISFSRESFWPRDWTHVSCFAGRFSSSGSIQYKYINNIPIF